MRETAKNAKNFAKARKAIPLTTEESKMANRFHYLPFTIHYLPLKFRVCVATASPIDSSRHCPERDHSRKGVVDRAE